jgi:HPt (histidine-containing phosphotransfer) domain-containing protein
MIDTAVGSDWQVGQPVLDLAHLCRMTLGDADLQREVLELFEAQAADWAASLRQADPANLSLLAHTIKGAALGIGAMALAEAAKSVERSGAADGALLRLAQALEEARSEIREILAKLEN